ncbi:DUF4351 domain-containing protein [Sorangium sp. So ce887]|uniref:DUF4351 domain-containing protein n=1 Tax=Sorangium sp. So ce887 TaxID=3133324 RepID=UPI003F61FC76
MQTNTHDALFKAAFSQVEHAAGELRQALSPELSSQIDFAELWLQRLLVAAGEPWKEEIVSAADQLVERGRQVGLREGLREGLQQGRRHVLLRQLGARFGALPGAAVARINAADIAELDRWSERVLTAPTLADVLSEP